MKIPISKLYKSITSINTQSKTIKELHQKIKEASSNNIDYSFKGSFPPGKPSKKEIKHLNEAKLEIEEWNEAISKLRKRIS